MALVLLYFALFFGVHSFSKQIRRSGAAKLFQLTACFVLLFVFFGFRDITVLNDTPHYYGHYYHKAHLVSYLHESIFKFHLLDKFEYGYQILVHFLIKYVSKNSYTIIILSSFIFTVGNLWFISRQTKQIALVCFLMIISGVLFDQYSMIRQSIAIMIFYRAYFLLKEDKYTKYSILILLASQFHTSALMLLVLPLLKQFRPSWRNILLMFLVSSIIALSIYSILSLIGLDEHIYYKMGMKRQTPPIAAILDGLLMVILVVTYMLSIKKNPEEYNPTDFWICILGLCICIVTPEFLPLFRLNAYLWPIIYLLFFKSTLGKKLFPLLVLILLARISVILEFKTEWNHIVPYSFYDFSDKYHDFQIYWQKEN